LLGGGHFEGSGDEGGWGGGEAFGEEKSRVLLLVLMMQELACGW
jgi:hypothetical protein